MFTLDDQRVLVVGGSSGIGLAVAALATQAGARVTIASRSQDKIDAALPRIGAGTSGFVLDVTSDNDVADRLGNAPVWDHVVVTAAAARSGSVRDLPLEDAYQAMNSKFWGAYRVARAVRIVPRGSLTLTSGFLSIRPKAAAPLQGAINAALEGLTKGLALELAPWRVNAVSPGFIDTPLWGGKSPQDHAALLAGVASRLPVGLAGQPEHVALQVLALMQNPYMTGSISYIDGGGSVA